MSAKRPPESRATEGSLAQTLTAENDAEVAARRSAGPPPATPPPPVPPALSPPAATTQLGLTGRYERLGKALDLALVRKRNLIYALFACVETLFPTTRCDSSLVARVARPCAAALSPALSHPLSQGDSRRLVCERGRRAAGCHGLWRGARRRREGGASKRSRRGAKRRLPRLLPGP